eukprot:2122634-Pyramimonas_sp.AAC.1
MDRLFRGTKRTSGTPTAKNCKRQSFGVVALIQRPVRSAYKCKIACTHAIYPLTHVIYPLTQAIYPLMHAIYPLTH